MTVKSKRIGAILQGLGSSGAFAARRTAGSGDLAIEVRGVGPLHFPLPKAQAEALCGVARQAPYGQGQRTLVDTRVRDTWEVPKSRIKIDARRWKKTLAPDAREARPGPGVSGRVQASRGVSEHARLRAGAVFPAPPGQRLMAVVKRARARSPRADTRAGLPAIRRRCEALIEGWLGVPSRAAFSTRTLTPMGKRPQRWTSTYTGTRLRRNGSLANPVVEG